MAALDASQKKKNLKSKVASLYASMSKRLKIKQAPKLIFTNDPTNANKSFGMTGYYNNGDKTIRIYITDRHPTDILRSFAHEVIHHWQNEHGQLGNETKPHYTQNDPQLRKKEMEAYLLGNILFRDWQDEQRYGPPEKLPFLVSLNENLSITNPPKLRDMIKQMVRQLIANQIIVSYQRKGTPSSGKMNAEDFIEDFADKISTALASQIDMINDRGNWESQGTMVK